MVNYYRQEFPPILISIVWCLWLYMAAGLWFGFILPEVHGLHDMGFCPHCLFVYVNFSTFAARFGQALQMKNKDGNFALSQVTVALFCSPMTVPVGFHDSSGRRHAIS